MKYFYALFLLFGALLPMMGPAYAQTGDASRPAADTLGRDSLDWWIAPEDSLTGDSLAMDSLMTDTLRAVSNLSPSPGGPSSASTTPSVIDSTAAPPSRTRMPRATDTLAADTASRNTPLRPSPRADSTVRSPRGDTLASDTSRTPRPYADSPAGDLPPRNAPEDSALAADTLAPSSPEDAARGATSDPSVITYTPGVLARPEGPPRIVEHPVPAIPERDDGRFRIMAESVNYTRMQGSRHYQTYINCNFRMSMGPLPKRNKMTVGAMLEGGARIMLTSPTPFPYLRIGPEVRFGKVRIDGHWGAAMTEVSDVSGGYTSAGVSGAIVTDVGGFGVEIEGGIDLVLEDMGLITPYIAVGIAFR